MIFHNICGLFTKISSKETTEVAVNYFSNKYFKIELKRNNSHYYFNLHNPELISYLMKTEMIKKEELQWILYWILL